MGIHPNLHTINLWNGSMNDYNTCQRPWNDCICCFNLIFLDTCPQKIVWRIHIIAIIFSVTMTSNLDGITRLLFFSLKSMNLNLTDSYCKIEHVSNEICLSILYFRFKDKYQFTEKRIWLFPSRFSHTKWKFAQVGRVQLNVSHRVAFISSLYL